MEEKTRPGIMVYFKDFRWIEKFMIDEQLGLFFKAIINYGEYGEFVSDDADMPIQMAFGAFRDKIDRDGISYQVKIQQKQYAGYCSRERKHNRGPLDYEEWIEQITTVGDRQRPLNSVQRIQPIGNASSNSKGNGKGTEKVERCKGDGKEEPGPQSMSRDEFMAILDQKRKERAECKHQQTIFDDEPDSEIPFD